MTQQQMIDLLKIAVPADKQASAQALGLSAIQAAILRFNKAEHADFNHINTTFNLIAGRRDYKVGQHIITANATRWLGIADVYVDGKAVDVLSREQYEGYALGNTLTGQPAICAFHSKDQTFVVWPTPTSALSTKVTIKTPISAYDDIPEEHQSDLLAIAREELIALMDAQAAMIKAQQAEVSIKSAGVQKWSGQNIPVGRGIDPNSSSKRVDSSNLLGN